MKRTIKEIGEFLDVYIVKTKDNRVFAAITRPYLSEDNSGFHGDDTWISDEKGTEITNFVETPDGDWRKILYTPERGRHCHEEIESSGFGITKEPTCPYCGQEDLDCPVHRTVASYVGCLNCGKQFITERAWDKKNEKSLGFYNFRGDNNEN